jgi:hypothetical protein
MKTLNKTLALVIIYMFFISKIVFSQNRFSDTLKIIQPVILVSDLMRPDDDPDDHWDLATAFALAYSGAIDLKGMIIDSPVNEAYVEKKNPDVAAVAMLNYITGLHVPVVTGSPYPLKSKTDKQEYALVKDMGGVNLMHDILSESKEKVRIIITGSTRDVAIAMNRFPGLFEDKCSGIYLNAGYGNDENPYERSRPEWNTKLDMQGYHAIFQANCPIYWLPCNVSHYRIKHGNVIPQLSENMKKFFTFMYEKRSAENWFQSLQNPLNDSTLKTLTEKHRSMFCTVGFLYMAGSCIDKNGQIVAINGKSADVAGFIPINIEEVKSGYVKYSVREKSGKTNLLKVAEDRLFYENQTEKAIKQLLKWLP